MQPKWTFFTIGIMAGIIAVLGTILLLQPREAKAADPKENREFNPMQDSAQGAGILVTNGASTQNQPDMLWVLHKRKVPPKPGRDEKDITNKEERLALCCYQILNGGKSIRLAAVRDISFDQELIEYPTNQEPHVREVVELLKKELKKEEKKP